LTAEIEQHDPQLNNEPSVRLEQVYRSLLRIVAQFGETAYTDVQLRQTAEVVLDDLADPASEEFTRRAETHSTSLSD
jgi:hypothetical protein